MASTARELDAAAVVTLAGIGQQILAQRGGDPGWEAAKQALREGIRRDPLDALVGTVLGGSYLFYLAEKDVNPKVRSVWDAAVFISTCLSVGYDDVFARTPSGKAIATVVMSIGPALAAAALEPPAAQKEAAEAARRAEEAADRRAILERLDALLVALKAQPPG